jgi:hypothetical protein
MSKAGASTFRFTIRDVLWLTVVVAVLVAWWVDRSRLSLENRSHQTKLNQMAKDSAQRDEAIRIYERAIERQQQIHAR